MFGTRKIYAYILNGKLIIRVGGGYMIIEEFISTYADIELNKMKHLSEKQQKEMEKQGGKTENIQYDQAKANRISKQIMDRRSSNNKMRGSPTRGNKSYVGHGASAINGTLRDKKITEG